MAGARSFDRVADRYDETRGGEERGRAYAAELHPLFATSGVAFEIGIGTGLVANGLVELGRSVIGIDVAPLMLEWAIDRIGARVAVADAECLPVRDASIENAYSVWVFHLVDPAAVFREVGRVLRPRGRFLACPVSIPEPDAILEITTPMYEALLGSGRRADEPDLLARAAEEAGLRVVEIRTCAPQRFGQSPETEAMRIEGRDSTAFWDLDDERWQRIVAPAMRALRELPEASREIERVSFPRIVVLEL